MKGLEKVIHKGRLYAIIVRKKYKKKGIQFFTPGNFSQQLAYMNHPQGYLIEAHLHNFVKRSVRYTQEVLFIKRGRVRLDFYNSKNWQNLFRW